jgi:DNA-binding MarR family transcriptional regulator|tara:strand:- start:980 stop:1129 length:150 start_codon:yes stop_codon:yes gene_type:complete
MAKRSYIHEEGFGILEINTSPVDERQRVVTLSPKGLELAMKMEDKIYGK